MIKGVFLTQVMNAANYPYIRFKIPQISYLFIGEQIQKWDVPVDSTTLGVPHIQMKNHFAQSGQYYIFKLGFDSASIVQRLKIKCIYLNAKYYISVVCN